MSFASVAVELAGAVAHEAFAVDAVATNAERAPLLAKPLSARADVRSRAWS